MNPSSHTFVRNARRAAPALAAIFLFAGLAPAHAQVQRSYLNQGFETPALTASNAATGCYKLLTEALVPGWTTTHPVGADGGDCTAPSGPSGPLMELWRTNYQGVPARQGLNFAELNASASSRLFQNVCLINGDQIAWRFSHRGRGSATVRDVMDYNIGASLPIVRVGTTSSGAFDAPVVSQGSVVAPASGGSGWVDYAGTFAYTGATGTTSMGFESISTGSGSNTVGNFLDNIQIDLRPLIEFVQPGSSTPESASSNLPSLRVNGTVSSPIAVTVTITGGTATLGADYTTPGNSATLTVTIPAGIYDGASAGSLFALPITIVQDLLPEAGETIQLRIQPPSGSPAPFLLSSSATCGGAAQTVWTYTIVDDDAAISVTKNAAVPVAVSGQPTRFDVVYTVLVNNPTALLTASYSLADAPGFDPDVAIISAAFSRNGGVSTALAGGGPWTLQAQWATLAPGATDTYVLTVRIDIARGGSVGNDACASPGAAGSGLYNTATATLQGATGNTTSAASACRNTPTPLWATLRKSLVARAGASDQAQIRLLYGGTPVATAVTTGAGAPATATTGLVVLPAGSTMQFDETIKVNGTGADTQPLAYQTTLVCTNAASGSTTLLPGGAGTAVGARRQWAEFTPASGDDLDCVITNTPRRADLRITKTNTPGVNGDIDQSGDAVVSGAITAYSIAVVNAGPDAADGAVITDPATAGLTCATASCTATGGAACPAQTGAALVSALQGGGATLPTLPVGGTVSFVLSCQVP